MGPSLEKFQHLMLEQSRQACERDSEVERIKLQVKEEEKVNSIECIEESS